MKKSCVRWNYNKTGAQCNQGLTDPMPLEIETCVVRLLEGGKTQSQQSSMSTCRGGMAVLLAASG